MHISFFDVRTNRMYKFDVGPETVINIRPDWSRPRIVDVAQFRLPRVISVNKVCPACRLEMPPDYAFCVQCGAGLAGS
jgi:hypothetical protein